MMKKIKCLAIIMAATMLASSLAGCGQGNSTDSSNSESSTTTTSTEASKEEKAKSWKDNNSPVELSVYADGNYFFDGWDSSPVAKIIEEKTGVKLKVDFPATGDANQKISMLIASDALPDILMMSRSNTIWHDAITSDKMNDMEELIDKYAPGMRNTVDSDIMEINRYKDGKLYYITNYTSTKNYFEQAKKYNKMIGTNQDVFLIRQDALESIGSPVINDKDSLTAALEKLHTKYPDKTTLHTRGTMGNYFGLSNYYIDGNEAKHNVYDPKYKEMLMWLNELTIKGIVGKESFIDDNTVVDAKIKKGEPIVALGYLIDSGKVIEDGSGSHYEALGPWPTYKTTVGINGWLGLGIPKKSEKAERAIQFLEYMNCPEGIKDYQYGVEGDAFGDLTNGPHYKMVDGKPTYFQEYLDARQKDVKAATIAYGTDCGFNLFGFDTLYANWATWTDTDPLYVKMNELFSPYVVVDAKMNNIQFESGSEPIIVKAKIDAIQEEEYIKVIFAKTLEEAEKAFNEMLTKIEAAGVDVFNKYVTEQYFGK